MRTPRRKKAPEKCVVAACLRFAICRKRCELHYSALMRLTPTERVAELAKPQPAPQKWEYEPRPEQVAELIAANEQNSGRK